MAFAEQGAHGRVMERADQRGDVAQRRTLDAALAERAIGLAFEIDNREVFAGEEQLAEAEIAVTADAFAAETAVDQGLKAAEHLRAESLNLAVGRLRFSWQLAKRRA